MTSKTKFLLYAIGLFALIVLIAPTSASAAFQCSDGINNETVPSAIDSFIDYPDDPNCISIYDNSEAPLCSDGKDNNGDGKIDMANSFWCVAPGENAESIIGFNWTVMTSGFTYPRVRFNISAMFNLEYCIASNDATPTDSNWNGPIPSDWVSGGYSKELDVDSSVTYSLNCYNSEAPGGVSKSKFGGDILTECFDGFDNDGDSLIDGQEDSCQNGEATEGRNPVNSRCSNDSHCQSSLVCEANICRAPTINSFTASPNPLPAIGGSANLAWASIGMTGCSVSPSCTGPNNTAPSGDCDTGNLSAQQVYTLSCIKRSGGTAARNLTVTITAPTLTFSVSPTPPLASGSSAILSWSSTNATSCTISPACTPPASGISGTCDTGSLNAPRTYTLSCTGPGGSRHTSLQVAITPPLPGCTPAYYTSCSWSLDCIAGIQTGSCTKTTPCVGPNTTTRERTCTLPGGTPCPDGQPCDPLGGISIYEFVRKALLAFVNLLIPIIVLFYVITGLMFITARGAPEKLKVAKTAFLYTSIGAGVVLGAWVFATLIRDTITAVGG